MAAATLLPFGGASAQTIDAAPAHRRGREPLPRLARHGQRLRALIAFEAANRLDWHYIPRSRPGLTPGRDAAGAARAARALFASVLNDRGLELLDERAPARRRAAREQGSFRDPARYYVSIFGTPGRFPWGWRFEGHHLSLNVALARPATSP